MKTAKQVLDEMNKSKWSGKIVTTIEMVRVYLSNEGMVVPQSACPWEGYRLCVYVIYSNIADVDNHGCL